MIYLATCKKCKGQYVGKSQTPFKMRHSNHKQEVKKQVGGLGQHYGGTGCGYTNISIQIIDQVKEGDTRALEKQERYWQNQLRCYIQNGGNAHCSYMCQSFSFWFSKLYLQFMFIFGRIVDNAE